MPINAKKAVGYHATAANTRFKEVLGAVLQYVHWAENGGHTLSSYRTSGHCSQASGREFGERATMVPRMQTGQ